MDADMYTYVLGCNLLGYSNFYTYKFVPYTYRAVIRSFYFFDTDSQYYTNHISTSKQPLIYKGTNGQAESSDPSFTSNYLVINSGKKLSQGPVDYEFFRVRVTTHMLKFRINTLPASGTYGDLFTISYDKIFKYQITSSGGFRIQSSETLYESHGISMTTNTWYWLKITLARGSMFNGFFECSTGIEILGQLEEGVSFRCKISSKLIISR